MMKNFFIRICFLVTHKISDVIDYVCDMRICKQNLATKVSSAIEEIHSNAPTPYLMLKRIFNHVTLSAEDSFLDVGCGNGRVLAFLKHKKSCNKITGVETSLQSYQSCKQWTCSHSNINCLNKNVLDISLAGYTVLYLYNPFGEKTLQNLIKKIEDEVRQPLTLIYASDNEYGDIFLHRCCWQLQKQFICCQYALIFFAQHPQRVSIWKYSPVIFTQKQSVHPNSPRVKIEDCKLSRSYSDKLKGIKKIDKTHAIYDDGSRDTNVIDKETYDEWYNSDQIEPSWDELGF
jgi:SAM-dependent methyltransferase